MVVGSFTNPTMSLSRANRVYNAAMAYHKLEAHHREVVSLRQASGRRPISYNYLGGSCLKIQGESIPQWGPALKGALYWLMRRPGRQATYLPSGRYYFEEA